MTRRAEPPPVLSPPSATHSNACPRTPSQARPAASNAVVPQHESRTACSGRKTRLARAGDRGSAKQHGHGIHLGRLCHQFVGLLNEGHSGIVDEGDHASVFVQPRTGGVPHLRSAVGDHTTSRSGTSTAPTAWSPHNRLDVTEACVEPLQAYGGTGMVEEQVAAVPQGLGATPAKDRCAVDL
jgi:hypothetical protein